MVGILLFDNSYDFCAYLQEVCPFLQITDVKDGFVVFRYDAMQ